MSVLCSYLVPTLSDIAVVLLAALSSTLFAKSKVPHVPRLCLGVALQRMHAKQLIFNSDLAVIYLHSVSERSMTYPLRVGCLLAVKHFTVANRHLSLSRNYPCWFNIWILNDHEKFHSQWWQPVHRRSHHWSQRQGSKRFRGIISLVSEIMTAKVWFILESYSCLQSSFMHE